MIKTAFRLIFRNWWRNKMFTLISILSLTVGIACTVLLISFVSYEYGIESGNPNRDKMVWVMQERSDNSGRKSPYMNTEVARQIAQNYPEVEEFVQIERTWVDYVTVDGHNFDGPLILNVDTSFPLFFPFEMLYGSWESLNSPTNIIITESQASILFGNENALGKQIELNEFFGGSNTLTVGGVVKDRDQTAIKFDGIFSNSTKIINKSANTLLKVVTPKSIKQLEVKVNEDEIALEGEKYFLYPFSDAISSNNLGQDDYWYHRNNDLILLGLISAILVFIIAVFNYVNMSFSRILQQVRVLYTEKLMGANPLDINLQIFLDVFLTVLISFVLAMLMMHDLLPIFKNIVNINIASSYFYSLNFFPMLILFALLFTIIPAWIMSNKISGLSETDYRMFFITKKNKWVSSMVVIQLIIAFALIISSITVNKQVEFAKNSIERYENLIEVGQVFSQNSIVDFDSQIKRIGGIENYAFMKTGLVVRLTITYDINKKNGDSQQSDVVFIDGGEGLTESLKLNQIAGVHWDKAKEMYSTPVFVNKTFVNIAEIPLDEIIGIKLSSIINDYDSLSVIAGVVEDFNIISLEQNALPLIMNYVDKTKHQGLAYIRASDGELNDVIKLLKQAWEQAYPDKYFSHSLVHDYFIKRNSKIFEMSRLLQMYSLISILLTCFGLFGITFYAVKQRTKEIGIRKINGARTLNILWLLMKPMFLWIAIGFAIAAPLAWLFVEKWLQQFAYRVDISITPFIIAILIVAITTMLTVSWHVWRTARANPSESLKSE